MKYAVIKVINGNFFVDAEGFTDIDKAKAHYHALCHTLWNAPDVIKAWAAVVDDELNIYEGYKEYIHHEPAEA